VYEVRIDLWPTAYVFNRDHRLRLAVSSSNYPRFEANPNNGLRIEDGGPILVAINTAHLGGNTSSRVDMPIVSFDQIPPNVPLP
jgi:predicted acyl esterase